MKAVADGKLCGNGIKPDASRPELTWSCPAAVRYARQMTY